MAPRPGRFGLPKRERILKSRRFKWVLRQGRRVYSQHFTLIFRGGTGVSCLGLTVSRKIGNAVMRNRVKRRLRECYRLHKHLLAEPRWLVIIARPGAAELDYQGVCREIVPHLRALGEPSVQRQGGGPDRRKAPTREAPRRGTGSAS